MSEEQQNETRKWMVSLESSDKQKTGASRKPRSLCKAWGVQPACFPGQHFLLLVAFQHPGSRTHPENNRREERDSNGPTHLLRPCCLPTPTVDHRPATNVLPFKDTRGPGVTSMELTAGP
ncbi:similar to FLJ46536 protein (predicted), partial [Rattus norvegicus]